MAESNFMSRKTRLRRPIWNFRPIEPFKLRPRRPIPNLRPITTFKLRLHRPIWNLRPIKTIHRNLTCCRPKSSCDQSPLPLHSINTLWSHSQRITDTVDILNSLSLAANCVNGHSKQQESAEALEVALASSRWRQQRWIEDMSRLVVLKLLVETQRIVPAGSQVGHSRIIDNHMMIRPYKCWRWWEE